MAYIGLVLSYVIGVKVYDRYHLQRHYILPQMIGVILFILISELSLTTIGRPIVISSALTMIILSSFTFSVGLNIAAVFEWKKHGPLTGFMLLFVLILAGMQFTAYKFLPSGIGYIAHPLNIGWSADTIKYFSSVFDKGILVKYLNLSLLVTFALTPLANKLFSLRIDNHFEKKLEWDGIHLKGLGILILAGLLSWLLYGTVFTGAPYFYPHMLSFLLGILIPKVYPPIAQANIRGNGKVLLSLATIGVMGQAWGVLRSGVSLAMLIGVLTYVMAFLLMHVFMKGPMKDTRDNIVFLAGCWGLVSASAITAMNAMKSASKNDGKSPALVTVPVIGLIIVNIIQWGVYLMTIN